MGVALMEMLLSSLPDGNLWYPRLSLMKYLLLLLLLLLQLLLVFQLGLALLLVPARHRHSATVRSGRDTLLTRRRANDDQY